MYFGRTACSRSVRFHPAPRIPLVFLCALFVVPPFYLHAQFESGKHSYEKTAPYNGLTVESGKVKVRIDDEWSELISIQCVSVERLLKKCEEENWNPEVRLGEDVVQVLSLMDTKVGSTVSMKLRNDAGDVISMDSVPMTRANRKTIRLAKVEKDPQMKALLDQINNNPFNSSKPGFPNWGPFTHLRWNGDIPFTKIDGDWVEVRKM